MAQTYKQRKESRKKRGICLTCPNPLEGMSLRCRKCTWKMNQQNGKSTESIINEAKSVPCSDCGVSYGYWVMEFDHVRGVKEFNISSCRGDNVGLGRLRAEIAKCDVVCANCHRDRTYWRMVMAGKVTPKKVYPPWDAQPLLVELEAGKAMEEYSGIKEQIEALEARKKELGMELEGFFRAAELTDGVRFGEYVFSPRTSTTAGKIDATLLLERGVDADTIAECTVAGKPYTYMDCRKDKPTNVPNKQ